MATSKASPEKLHVDWLAVAGFVIWIGVFVGSVPLTASLVVDGAVRVPPTPAQLELKGVPGERIRLNLFDLPENARLESSDLRVRFEDRESGWALQETVLAYEQTFTTAIFATITVPDIEVEDHQTLKGTLFGSIEFDKGEPRNLEIPLRLQLGRKGEVVTSGSSNAPLPGWMWFFLSMGALSGPFVAGSAVLSWRDSRRRQHLQKSAAGAAVKEGEVNNER